MLVLTRRIGETLLIELPTGETIRATVTGVNGNQARLGTQAPEDVRIVRESCYFVKNWPDSYSNSPILLAAVNCQQ